VARKLKPTNIIQALALFDEKSASEYGLALWAALHEVDGLYRLAHAQIEYRRFYIAPVPPNFSSFENISRALGKWFPGVQVQTGLNLLKHDQVLSSLGPSAELSLGRRRTYDQAQLAAVIRKLVDPNDSGDHLMIITDRPITPPAKWRYIIWEIDRKPNTSVISVAPLDPEYWRDKDPNRVMRIKTRTRNAVLSITGELIGLEHCDNPACFMFDDVDSVTVLDEMYAFGAEHDLLELTGYGFDDMISNPTLVQTATIQSISKRVL
jgi:predicted Zn-dependent protease